CARDSNSDYW
nr:immunoglobulin heavy chain junction region [Mus musculus]